MCGLTAMHIRAVAHIPRAGTYVVCRGRVSEQDIYIPVAAWYDEYRVFKPLYIIRVKQTKWVPSGTPFNRFAQHDVVDRMRQQGYRPVGKYER